MESVKLKSGLWGFVKLEKLIALTATPPSLALCLDLGDTLGDTVSPSAIIAIPRTPGVMATHAAT